LTVEKSDAVDFIGTDPASGRVVLTISDHLPWDDAAQHFQLLERKIAGYVSFVKSGQLAANYPDSEGRATEIGVVFQHPPPVDAKALLAAAGAALQRLGIAFSYQVLVGTKPM